MTRKERFEWMAIWVAKNGAALSLNGECGIGRKCIGILASGIYPDYSWFDENKPYKRLDNNGDVWIPKDSYHNQTCVAVLGWGEESERQLYEWLKWFSENNFKIESGYIERKKQFDIVEIILSKHIYARMVKEI